jgi:hypothetical protein
MTIYTASWYVRCMTDGQWGGWVRRSERVEYPDDEAASKHVFPHEAIDSPYTQLESGQPATLYVPKKRKNTNAWKRKEYR